MSDGHHGAFVFLQVTLEPRHTFSIQMVGRFVQQQQVRRAKKQARKCDTTTLTARQIGHRRIRGWAAQRFTRNFDLSVQIPCIRSVNLILQFSLFCQQVVHFIVGHFFHETRGHFIKAVDHGLKAPKPFHDVFTNRLAVIQLRFLRQIADARTVCCPAFAVKFLVQTSHQLQQC